MVARVVFDNGYEEAAIEVTTQYGPVPARHNDEGAGHLTIHDMVD